MFIKNKVLYINNSDFDHIMGWSDNKCPSEAFIEELKIELMISGLEDKEEEFEKIILNFLPTHSKQLIQQKSGKSK